MARSPSELTVAIWSLLEANPELTHLESRSLLKKAGFTPMKKPPATTKSDNYNEWASYEGYSKPENADVIAEACGFDAVTRKAVLIEVRYHQEVNGFNVIKANWRKKKASGEATTSSKPPTPKRGRPPGSKNKGKGKGRRGRRKNLIPAEELAAFDQITAIGGVEGAQKEIDEAHALIADLEAKLELVKSLQERVKVAA